MNAPVVLVVGSHRIPDLVRRPAGAELGRRRRVGRLGPAAERHALRIPVVVIIAEPQEPPQRRAHIVVLVLPRHGRERRVEPGLERGGALARERLLEPQRARHRRKHAARGELGMTLRGPAVLGRRREPRLELAEVRVAPRGRRDALGAVGGDDLVPRDPRRRSPRGARGGRLGRGAALGERHDARPQRGGARHHARGGMPPRGR
mmetsp:Transcript_12799/g.51337  ORF Transcript_12799/g.51337 Transcript_12799/m.51337 type:complete len:205 (-) Transcript_12799:19-633(-)